MNSQEQTPLQQAEVRIKELEEQLEAYQPGGGVQDYGNNVHVATEIDNEVGFVNQRLTIYIRPGSKFRVNNVIFSVDRIKRHGFWLKPVGDCVVIAGEHPNAVKRS